MLKLDDLMEVEDFPHIKHFFGKLHKAEALVEDFKFTNTRIELKDTLHPEIHRWRGFYFMRGYLKGGEKIRTIGELFGVDFKPKEIPKEKLVNFVEERISFPSVGDVVGVYWWSKEALPKKFRGERFVKVMTEEERSCFNPTILFRKQGEMDYDYFKKFEDWSYEKTL